MRCVTLKLYNTLKRILFALSVPPLGQVYWRPPAAAGSAVRIYGRLPGGRGVQKWILALLEPLGGRFCVFKGSWVDFGGHNASQNDPKAIPKRVKNQDEKCITFLSLLELSWSDLGSILDLFWRSKSLIFLWFYNEFVNIDFFEKRPLQDAFLLQLDSI